MPNLTALLLFKKWILTRKKTFLALDVTFYKNLPLFFEYWLGFLFKKGGRGGAAILKKVLSFGEKSVFFPFKKELWGIDFGGCSNYFFFFFQVGKKTLSFLFYFKGKKIPIPLFVFKGGGGGAGGWLFFFFSRDTGDGSKKTL